MSWLVTGGAGYIGAHVVRAFLAEGIDTVVVDDLSSGQRRFVPDGVPSVRTVLLKGIDERGLTFYTHYTSRKGSELEANLRAAVTMLWHPLQRQVRVGALRDQRVGQRRGVGGTGDEHEHESGNRERKAEHGTKEVEPFGRAKFQGAGFHANTPSALGGTAAALRSLPSRCSTRCTSRCASPCRLQAVGS